MAVNGAPAEVAGVLPRKREALVPEVGEVADDRLHGLFLVDVDGVNAKRST